ncbi:MAG: SDR family oxidoreductase [Brevinematales bacterium]|nr:SDR family oxidoreductase [Brevinematales bacterium]
MKIFILGGSKGIGLCLTKLALEKGYDVTVMSRSAENMPIVHKNLTKINGDGLDLQKIEENVEKVDVLISTIGTRNNKKNQNLFSETTKNLLSAINGYNKLLISVTGIGVKETLDKAGFLFNKIILPFFLKNIYRDKNIQEEIIKHCNTQWIIVRPAFLTNGPLTGRYRIVTDFNNLKVGKISRMDVAHFILSQIEDPVYLKMAPVLTY